MIYSCLINFISFMPSLQAYYICTHGTTFDACFLIWIYLCTPLGTHLATRWAVF